MKREVVFLHGDFLNHSIFKYLSDYFLSLGHKIHYFDIFGHGLSEFNEYMINPELSFEEFMKKNKIIEPIFVAHSSGAMILSDYIEKNTNVYSIIFINPLLTKPILCNPCLDINGMIAYFDKITNESFTGQEFIDYSKINNEQETRLLGLKTTNPKAFVKLREYYSSDIKIKKIFDLKIPILYIASKNDSFMSNEYHSKMVGKMKNIKFVNIESKHNPFISDSLIVNQIVDENYSFVAL